MQTVLLWLVALGPIIIPLARRVFIALGFGAATFTGISVLWSNLETLIWENLGASSSSILTILGMARVDDAMKVLLSAGSTVLLLKGLNAATGALSRTRNTGAFTNV